MHDARWHESPSTAIVKNQDHHSTTNLPDVVGIRKMFSESTTLYNVPSIVFECPGGVL